mmetsp:Transcript_77786/g.154544  ORF Transcript_77786/g.154544 Transcript_77786/m.154544 type:complete len:504 (-) Transcript_77786:248-1759(-)
MAATMPAARTSADPSSSLVTWPSNCTSATVATAASQCCVDSYVGSLGFAFAYEATTRAYSVAAVSAAVSRWWLDCARSLAVVSASVARAISEAISPVAFTAVCSAASTSVLRVAATPSSIRRPSSVAVATVCSCAMASSFPSSTALLSARSSHRKEVTLSSEALSASPLLASTIRWSSSAFSACCASSSATRSSSSVRITSRRRTSSAARRFALDLAIPSAPSIPSRDDTSSATTIERALTCERSAALAASISARRHSLRLAPLVCCSWIRRTSAAAASPLAATMCAHSSCSLSTSPSTLTSGLTSLAISDARRSRDCPVVVPSVLLKGLAMPRLTPEGERGGSVGSEAAVVRSGVRRLLFFRSSASRRFSSAARALSSAARRWRSSAAARFSSAALSSASRAASIALTFSAVTRAAISLVAAAHASRTSASGQRKIMGAEPRSGALMIRRAVAAVSSPVLSRTKASTSCVLTSAPTSEIAPLATSANMLSYQESTPSSLSRQ